MGQYGNQPDFGTKAVAITPKGIAGGSYVNVSYKDSEGGDANVYLTSANLNVSTFTDGTPITQATNSSEWLDNYLGETPCWAYANFSIEDTLGLGKIYNRWAAENPGLYSTGYTLTTVDLVNQFTTDAGYNSILGKELKSIPEAKHKKAPVGIEWNEEGGGTDIFGFTGFPGGSINSSQEYVGLHGSLYLWTDNTADGVWWRLDYQESEINVDSNNPVSGYYIRLIVNPELVSQPQLLNSAALYVGTGGDLVVTIVGSEIPVMFKNVPDASFLPIIVSNVWERGDIGITTASDIIAIY